MGKGCSISISTKQKINTRSSTESEVVGANNDMYLVLWVRYFLENQEYNIKDNVVYQGNQSAMRLENNGCGSSTENTRHMEIRYFLLQIIFIEISYQLNTVPPMTCWGTILQNHNKVQR